MNIRIVAVLRPLQVAGPAVEQETMSQKFLDSVLRDLESDAKILNIFKKI